jgi:OOP family OmpA-OmpF porin
MRKETARLMVASAVLAFGVVGCASGPKTQAPAPAPTPKSYVIPGVNFEFNSAKLTPKANGLLDEAASGIKQTPNTMYEVAGHTDSIGSDAYNLRLGGQRAASVVQGLQSRGVSASQLTAKSYGESKPVASNETAEGRAQNRRVEINPK